MKMALVVAGLLLCGSMCAQVGPSGTSAQNSAADHYQDLRQNTLKVCGKNSPPPCATVAPKVKHYVDPQYSPEAKRQGIEGAVIIWIVVDSTGKVEATRVAGRALGYGLDKEAIDAVRQWRFEPAKDKDGKPVAVQVDVKVSFHLD